jgi:predicted secreted protein
MSTAAQIAKGTVLKIGNGASPEVFTAIAEVQNIVGPGYSQASVEVTSHDSPSFFAEFIAGKREAGEVTIDGNYLPGNTQHTQLRTDLESGNLRNFQLVRSDTGLETVALSGYVTKYEPTQDFSKQFTFKATIKITGKPTYSGN